MQALKAPIPRSYVIARSKGQESTGVFVGISEVVITEVPRVPNRKPITQTVMMLVGSR